VEGAFSYQKASQRGGAARGKGGRLLDKTKSYQMSERGRMQIIHHTLADEGYFSEVVNKQRGGP